MPQRKGKALARPAGQSTAEFLFRFTSKVGEAVQITLDDLLLLQNHQFLPDKSAKASLVQQIALLTLGLFVDGAGVPSGKRGL